MRVFNPEKFKAMLLQRGSIPDIAKKCQVSLSSLYNYIHGKSVPSDERLKTILCVGLAYPTIDHVYDYTRQELTISAGVGVKSIKDVPATTPKTLQDTSKLVPESVLKNIRNDGYIDHLVRNVHLLCPDAQVLIVQYVLKGE